MARLFLAIVLSTVFACSIGFGGYVLNQSSIPPFGGGVAILIIVPAIGTWAITFGLVLFLVRGEARTMQRFRKRLGTPRVGFRYLAGILVLFSICSLGILTYVMVFEGMAWIGVVTGLPVLAGAVFFAWAVVMRNGRNGEQQKRPENGRVEDSDDDHTPLASDTSAGSGRE